MNSNTLKIIACISMLIDHMGVVLFPDIDAFRIIGRLAMPIFAFMIGEGCLHTKNKFRYFISVFSLAAICQIVYEIYEYQCGIKGYSYLNILFTFSLSIILCSAYLALKNSLSQKKTAKTVLNTAMFLAALGFVILLDFFLNRSFKITGIHIKIDYGLAGVLLPMAAVVFTDREQKLVSFMTALFLFSYFKYGISYRALAAVLTIPLLCFYNGKRGSKKGKYFFYVFYPLHLLVIHLLDYFI